MQTLVDLSVPGSRGRSIALRELRSSPFLPAQELQLRADAYGHATVFWRTPLVEPAADLTLAGSVVVLRTGPPDAPVLRGYTIEDGALAWEIEDAGAADWDLVVLEEGALVVERLDAGAMRAVVSATGEVRWTQALADWRDRAIVVITDRGDRLRIVYAQSGAVVELDLASGTPTSLAPATAAAVCATDAESVWLEASGDWMMRALAPGAPTRRIGSAPAGLLECARWRDRVWISWIAERQTEHRSMGDARVVASDALESAEIAADARGALVVLRDGELAWARRLEYGSAWLHTHDWEWSADHRAWSPTEPSPGECYFQVRDHLVAPPGPRHPPPRADGLEEEYGEWLEGPNVTLDCETGVPIARSPGE